MNTSANDFIEVPEPLFKYNGGKVIHDDNLAIMSTFEDAVILDKETVKTLQTELSEIAQRLNLASVDVLLSKLDTYTQEYHSARIDYEQLKVLYCALSNIFNDHYTLFSLPIPKLLLSINKLILETKQDGIDLKRIMKKIKARLSPHRADIMRHYEIHQILKSHEAALDDKRKADLLQTGMAEEANIIIDQISQTLSRMGFSHSYTVGKKNKTDYVEFDHVVATPDQLQCKIKASKQGLWGGSIDLLPQGVFVTDIIKPKIMDELSVVLEREVWSPHTSEERIPLVNGAWIIVERLGLVEGIPKNVTYKQLMARYETAEHDKFPIPAGLKRGRRVNWVHLDSPSGIHLMFTGISGSGKSNAMRGMVASIIEKQSPADIMFAFVDLKKQGDFREFEQAPHCVKSGDKGVLTEIQEVVEILQQIRAEMHMRQSRIGTVANNLIDYNKRVQPEYRMPRIVIVFDEYANTRRLNFLEESRIIDDICIEIGQVGRAAGISLWIGIQQPRRDNMPSALRDNITTQFVGHQANVGAAQSVTGNRESLKLEDIPGRMSANVGWKTEKVQMPFISEDDVKLAVQIANDNYGDLRAYQLADIDDDTVQVATLSDEELVLQTAFDDFQGDLKARPIHGILKGQISRNRITEIISNFASEKYLEYRGNKFRVDKQPANYYALVQLDENSSDTEDTQYLGVS